MQFSVHYDQQHGYITAKFTGTLDGNTAQQCTNEIKKLSAEHHCKHLLIDVRDMKVDSVMDYYDLLRTFSDLGIDIAWRRVVLISKNQDGPDVFDTEQIGRGNSVKVCSDPKIALSWMNNR